MTRIVLLGATGRIGGHALDRALAAGYHVVAVVRDPTRLPARPGLTLLAGDLADPGTIDVAVDGAHAVIAAVGPRTNSLTEELALESVMGNVVRAMTASRIRRLVALSGAGIEVSGDRKPWLDRLASRVVRRMARHIVGAKQREYDVFSSADLDWTALRPPLVVDGPAQGYRPDLRLTPGARVRRADVGAALVDQVTDGAFIHAAPFVLPPR